MKRNIAQEVRDIKSRSGVDAVAAKHSHELYYLIGKSNGENDPVLKFVPVYAVTLMEVLMKDLVSKVIDHGSPYKERLESLKKEVKFDDIGAVIALDDREFTVGDFVAHILPLQDLTNINRIMSILLDKDFFEEISKMHNRFLHEVVGDPIMPILGEQSLWRPILEEMFGCRHQIVHEHTGDDIISLTQATNYADTTTRWLSAAFDYIANLLDPNYPLTQRDMNEITNKEYHDANQRLEILLKQKGVNLDEDSAHKAWVEYRQAEIDRAADTEIMGSLRPLMAAMTGLEITNARIHLIEMSGLHRKGLPVVL